MKIHISNVYGMIQNNRIAEAQKRIARAGKDLGYLELGIYNYPIWSDTNEELEKRIEGILAAIEEKDAVILQLPSGNGLKFDALMIKRIREYQNVKLILLWHSLKYFMEQKYELSIWSDYECDVQSVSEAISYSDDYCIKKMLTDACSQVLKGYSKSEDTIQIGIELYDKEEDDFLRAGIAMQSIIEHTNAEVVFHILHDNTLLELNKRRLMYIVAKTGQKVRFYLVDEPKPILLFPEVCAELARIIYLDADVLVNCDIKELWDIDIKEYCIATAPNSRENDLNTGVIYMNLDKIRNMENVICKEDVLLLDDKWNRFAQNVRNEGEIESKACIYHYAGTSCELYYGTYMDQLYMQTAGRTPWGTDIARELLKMSVNKQLSRAEDLEKSINEISRQNPAVGNELKIKVKSIDDTLDYILKYHSSVSRFGDGEMDIMAGNGIPYQDYRESLATQLKEIVSMQSNEKLVVCLSDVFEHRERYNDYAAGFWKGHIAHYRDLYESLCKADWYGSTFISRPYMDLVDKTPSERYFKKIRMLWEKRDVLIVEGKTSRSGVGNELFDNAASIKRIICPSQNAYDKLDEIKNEILKNIEGRLVLLMLGPTAKVLAKIISDEGYQAIDIGHIDSEYEWFKMGATYKIKLNHKHTAEHNFDQDITFIEDENYNNQIIADLSES